MADGQDDIEVVLKGLSDDELKQRLLVEDASLAQRIEEIEATDEATSDKSIRELLEHLFKKTFSKAKLRFLREIEKKIQAKWAEAKVYEADAVAGAGAAPDAGAFGRKDRAFINFPYPYTNGRYHLGHVFTFMKGEFVARFQRLLGKNVLLPFGFHCTGSPIQAAADKIKLEMELYGNPPVFPETSEIDEAALAAAAADGRKFKAARSKLTAKSGGKKYQWQIMESIGVKDIAAFADPLHWLEYFPPFGQSDLQELGCAVDWRRSFITTEVNPFYDSFIRWQARQLKDKIKFGKRYCIWSPKEDNPCMDHERDSGEGVGPQEYTLIKLRVVNCPVALAAIVPAEDQEKVFLVAGTLRPETMYGQTNCWIKPSGTYGVFKLKDGATIVCSEASALNMGYQDIFFEKYGAPVSIGSISGTDLIGVALKGPLAFKDVMYALPMESIKMDKATGVVTSVPSDAPADYINLEDLKNKPGQFTKYNIQEEWLAGTDPVAIIETPELGSIPAPKACEIEKVSSRNDAKELEKAKDRVYMLGNHHGVMLVGAHKGAKVSDAKDLIKAELIASGDAYPYAEPMTPVVSRSGATCVVCLADQWYIEYGRKDWKEIIEPYVENELECFYKDGKTEVSRGFGWVGQWSVSRTYGLGTKLPWDEQYVIESLSDSTIYMSYYTFCHYLHTDMYGKELGPANVKPEQLTDDFWSFVLLGKALPEGVSIPIEQATLDAMRNEFEYWYPFDMRVTGYDLAQNHIGMSLYTHAAIFPKEKWPRGIRLNGMLLLDEKKMSKSTGNFLSVQDGIHRYGVDALRLNLGRAGDGMSSGNFKRIEAQSTVSTLHALLTWANEVATAEELAKLRVGDFNFFDNVFVNELRGAVAAAKDAYAATMIGEALDVGYQALLNSWKTYVANTGALGLNVGLHRELLTEYLESLSFVLAPVCPHVSEYLWGDVLKREGFIVNTLWPEKPAPVTTFSAQYQYLESALKEGRSKIAYFAKQKKTAATSVIVWIGGAPPAWQTRLVEIVKTSGETDFGKLMKLAATDPIVQTTPKKQKKGWAGIIKKTLAGGDSDSFDELALITQLKAWIAARLEVEVEVYTVGVEGAPATKTRAAAGKPGFEPK